KEPLMAAHNWLRNLFPQRSSAPRRDGRRQPPGGKGIPQGRVRPRLEELETRVVPSLTYSEVFTQNQVASTQASQDWVNFRAALTPSAYTSVTISGTFDSVGRTLNSATQVPLLATALKNGTTFHFFDGANTWNVGACGGNGFENPATEFNANT